jgi:Regulator of ribonuclease activity B
VKQGDVDEAVIELFRRAKEFHGDYDGWETNVISQ